ncbi:uncharacterized protein K460DRAFT_364899 [Cucurbitaria berberidis CBS 394.84]|uniref:WKF domain-containing protein n=1 Tax=Cucurbitaria berberidis CBS 394.84 TaxID=1168544 RepID=A0A9P4GPD7_9PLEO|nr:uncharacterized protein K460DRAFT_364899 [Cucurbitaria berberidis CBS 394.84]KAF1848971.1 hypothetical protein K460DRAFT_364899 [Cucurbitaria berberidis CBS 394.84]
MAHPESRIPAWRRLGLALKNEDQSAVTAPEHHSSHSEEPQHAAKDTPDKFQSPVEPAVNGKSSNLGKRKHQSEPAEGHGENSKKTRTAREEDEKTNGVPDLGTPTITNSGINAVVESGTEGSPATQTARPKGDSNYRKKKSKPQKRRRDDYDDVQVEPTVTHAQSKHDHSVQPALSPDEPVSMNGQPTLLASTETELAPFATPQKHLTSNKHKSKHPPGSPPQTDRRKSVAFTPDTKTTDGNTGQDLFKKWVAEQKGTGPVSQPPEVSNFNLHSLIAEEEKAARKSGQLEKKQTTEEATPRSDNVEQSGSPAEKTTAITVSQTPPSRDEKTATPTTSKGKKKDPSIYISYLTQYHTNRNHWKFNKAKQNDVVDNALNVFRIPDEHSDALTEYVAGLKGAGVIERLKERCKAALKELDEQDAQNPIPMDDPETRKAAQEEALQERVTKERKRRKVEGDVESLLDHPNGDGYIRRLQRKRAEALLTALGRTAPVLPAVAQTNGFNPMLQNLAPPPRRDSQKRKRRGEVSSD